jgi:UDP-2,3-diacylglucosamine hydrolase
VGNSPGPLGILAGGGTLPRRVAEAAAHQGRPVFIVAFTGQFDPATVEGFPHISLRIGEAGRIIAEMRKAGVIDLVMAGGVRRPSISELGLDWRGVQLFTRIGARALGDDGLLAAIGHELEREGFRLIGASEILGGGAITAGALGTHLPDEQAQADIAHGFHVARALGAVDVGQAVVVQQGLVLGVEAIEGTDALLQRVGPLKRDGLGGVLVKIVKPQQDRRIDLPTIGPATVRQAAASGLRGIAVEAGVTIILDQAEAVAAADDAGLFLVAIDPSRP